MSVLTKDSKIVEVCQQIMYKPNEVKNEDYQDAQKTLKELASNPNPNNLYELAQLVGFLVDDRFATSTSYLDQIADVKRVADGDKAMFKMQRGTVTALWQAKGATAQRSMVGTEYKSLETDEISAAPAIELDQLVNGQIDFTSIVNEAAQAMENKLVKQVETVIAAYWDDLASPWYASGSGVVANSIDPIITAVARLGSPVILADMAAAQKFVSLTGFNSNVADSIAVEFHKTGIIGNYRGARITQLVNPLTNDTDMTTTLLDPGYVYVIPAGADASKRPLKVALEGSVQTFETKYAQSRILEIAMYKKAGIGLASTRYGMGLYIDTAL